MPTNPNAWYIVIVAECMQALDEQKKRHVLYGIQKGLEASLPSTIQDYVGGKVEIKLIEFHTEEPPEA